MHTPLLHYLPSYNVYKKNCLTSFKRQPVGFHVFASACAVEKNFTIISHNVIEITGCLLVQENRDEKWKI